MLENIKNLIGNCRSKSPQEQMVQNVLSKQFNFVVESDAPQVILHPEEMFLSEEQRFRFAQKIREENRK